MSSYRNYYDSTFRRTEPSKPLEPRTPSRIATKYGGAYPSNLPSSTRVTTPVPYKPLSRTSRDPSPSLDKSEKSSSSSSGYLNSTRYPRQYSRNTLSPAPSTTNLPRLTKETGIPSKYGSSRSSSASKDSSSGQKYLNSRFLPKNSVERSFTAYSRPSSLRTSEVARKNKELLTTLQVQQEQERLSPRPTSRCSSVAPEDRKTQTPEKDIPREMETVKVCTRCTSPTFSAPAQHSFLRSRRIEVAKTIEKTITRPKTIKSNMVDKEIQSDRLDDSTRSSRFVGASRISATPWTSFLDMKFSSPNNKKKSKDADSPKSLSRTSSTKSIASVKSDKDLKKSPPKSKLTPPKQVSDKNQLPPIPKTSDSSSKSFHSLSTPNKDFRKSVLNMSPGKKLGRRSNSASSAESDNADPDATDISETLNSCVSYHNSGSSMLPRRSPSSDASTSEDDCKSKKTNSGRTSVVLSSVDDMSEKPEAKNFLMRALAPVTNLFKASKHSSDSGGNTPEAPGDKVVWILDPSSENTNDTSEHKSARLVLHRLVTDESSSSNPIQLSEPANMKYSDAMSKIPEISRPTILKPESSGEAPWWLDPKQSVPEGLQIYSGYNAENNMTAPLKPPVMRHNDSGEKPWWLDNNAEPPEGVQTWPHKPEAAAEKPKIRPIDSGEAPWWLKKDATPPEGVQTWTEQGDNWDSRYQLRHIDSGERPWWINDDDKEELERPKYTIRHQDSGEPAWWLQDNQPLGDRASPEGLEMPKEEEGRLSPYDNVPTKKQKHVFISRHTNIDDILGGTGQLWSPVATKVFGFGKEEVREVNVNEVIIHEGKSDHGELKRLDDAALQLYKDGDYGSYLDLEGSIAEQAEEFEGFQSNKKNSIVLRTQLSVRVHTIIEKLLTSEGRELRRALFSLKQIFQEDKDLVHEFVQNDGLSCLIKVGSEADQNYQNYILRALGQVMLYVDGMNGVIDHNQTIQWLYSLISSKFRLVVKTALKLLLVFVEYTDSNCMLLVKAIHTVDYSQGLGPYYNIMKLLKDFDSADTELLIYATTLINKILNGLPDQDTYYDQVDVLEEQGVESIIQRYMSKPGTDLDLLQQFQIYEAVLQYEDGEDIKAPVRHLDESLRKTLRSRKSFSESTERRKSRRHSTGTAPMYGGYQKNTSILPEDFDESSSSSEVNNSQLNGSYKDTNKANEAGVTPALRRRRERAERQRSFMREQQEGAALLKGVIQQNEDIENNNGHYTNALQQRLTNGNNLLYMNAKNRLDSEQDKPWSALIPNQEEDINENERNILMQIKKENTVKDITQKLANQSILQSPTDEKPNRFGDMCGLISKAKEGLAKSKSKAELLRSPTSENLPKVEVKKSENELRWEELVANMSRPLNLCDMDFTDLGSEDEADVLAPQMPTNGIPPPPPPLQNMGAPPPPPPSLRIPTAPPPLFGVNLTRNNSSNKLTETRIPIKKNKKTVKLFWKEVRHDPVINTKFKTGCIWDELNPVIVDTQKLEHLFESRAKDIISKKQQELNKNKEIIVLDPKRSNAINIGMTKLPPPRSIKTAILKMDSTVMNREGIEKLLTMLPTEEERTKIQEAQAANPDLPLGSAEQFLLTLASISELPARLKLWAFKLDFENSEREIAEPLMDLKQGFEVLKVNKTFKAILSTLLSIGNFLNGNEVKGFQIEYLTKVPEVKDTVHKHSLLHHLSHIVMEKFPEASDLYSEIGAITRASKVDFDELTLNVQRLEAECKASWDHLKLIAKHDGSTMMKVKMSDFLADCAERIILLEIIHRRIMNRFHKFLLWLGIPFHQVGDTKPNEFCRIVSEFALEYRTTRERVLQQLEKKANHRERNKTRGKMITDMGKFRSNEDRADAELRQLLGSDISDVESMQGTLPWRHRRRDGGSQNSTLGRNSVGPNGHLNDGDDEILESLVKTATKGPRQAPRERKRTRHVDRKSLRRTLKNGLSEEEKKHLSAYYIKGY